MIFQPGIFSCTNPRITQSSEASSCFMFSKKWSLISLVTTDLSSCSTLRTLIISITHLDLVVIFLQRLAHIKCYLLHKTCPELLIFLNKYAPPPVLSIWINATSTYSVSYSSQEAGCHPFLKAPIHSSNHIFKLCSFFFWNCYPAHISSPPVVPLNVIP